MPKEYSHDLLDGAVGENTNIALGRTDEEKDEFKFSSRFFMVEQKQGFLVIDFPSAPPDIKFLAKDEEIIVFFIYKGTRLFFNSKVLGSTEYQLTEEKRVKAMKIGIPKKVFDGERRNFFKIVTPPHEVGLRLLKRLNETGNEPIEDVLYKGKTENLSAGGIAVSEVDLKFPLAYGDIVGLNIHLPDGMLYMEARVIHHFQREGVFKRVFGFEYIREKLDKRTFNRNVKILMKYVVKREREILAIMRE